MAPNQYLPISQGEGEEGNEKELQGTAENLRLRVLSSERLGRRWNGSTVSILLLVLFNIVLLAINLSPFLHHDMQDPPSLAVADSEFGERMPPIRV